LSLTLASLAFVWIGAFLGALAAGFPSPALFAREKVPIASAIGG